MTAVSFVVWRGTAPTLRFTLSPVVPGGIAGWTIKFSARKKASDPDPLILDLDATIVNPTTCIIDVPMTRADTLALQVRAYEVSLMRINSGGEDMLASGTMTVLYDIRDAK